MGRFTKESLELLRQRIDLPDLLSEHIDLKPAGGAYKGLCPFHEEKSPSFMVRRGDDHYHCFGCGAHGDAIEFLTRHLSMGFVEAVEHLAARYGVVLQLEEEDVKPRGPDKKRLKELMAAATRFYSFCLQRTEEGHQALHYLYDRGIDLDFVNRFQIGYAPGEGLVEVLKEQGFSRRLVDEVGLVRRGNREFFSQRIVFPICEASGSVIGFSGRKMREEVFGGKYINTPETPLFNKSKVLFGLNHSRRRIAKERRAIIVEGQIDCLRMIHSGIDMTVAALGTAFGAGHVAGLTNLGISKVTLAFDADQAGKEAAAKVGNLFQKVGVEVFVARFPTGSDPDSFLRDHGPGALVQQLEEGNDYLAFMVEKLAGTQELSPARKSEIVRDLSKQIHQWDDPLMVHESLRRLAHLAQVPDEVVGVGQRPLSQVFVQSSGRVGQMGIDPNRVLEADVLRWLLLESENQNQLFTLAQQHLRQTDFHNPICRKIYEKALEVTGDKERGDLLSLAISLDDAEGQMVLSEIVQKRVNREKSGEHFCEAVTKLLERNWMSAREQVRRKMQNDALSEEEMLELAKEFDAINKSQPQPVCI